MWNKWSLIKYSYLNPLQKKHSLCEMSDFEIAGNGMKGGALRLPKREEINGGK